MFINNIHIFLPKYGDIAIEQFLEILAVSNTKKFDRFKFEKDFLLTIILIKFGEKYTDLVFKWGTCLNKVYFPYFRLSEDLDFVLDVDLGRTARKTLLKEYEESFIEDLVLLGLTLRDERTKFDEYRLAMFTFEYQSAINNSLQTIKLDISLKGRLSLPPKGGKIQSIFIDSVYEEPIFSQEHMISCIDLTEALAEKMRAALTRREPAIRDFFDIWYAKIIWGFDFSDPVFLSLLWEKLREVDYAYTLEDNRELLEKQIITDLRPVLTDDYGFDFETIYIFILSHKI